MSSPERAIDLLLLGVNHKTAPLELRERLALDPEETGASLRALSGNHVVRESLILSTCNRTEVYTFATDLSEAEQRVRDRVKEARGEDLLRPGDHRYALRAREACRQLMRVATGLDSLVLGEMQILGQVKDAHALAREQGASGPLLDRLLAAAIHAGKRARRETAVGKGAVSVASAAVALAGKVFGELESKRVLILGAGETGTLAARHFAERHPRGLLVANRSLERAQELADDVDGEALPLTGLAEALPQVDVAVCATSSPEPLISGELVEKTMASRPDRPLVFVDIAVPRDVDPAAARHDNVFVYPIDALRSIVDHNLERRRREVPRVEAIVTEESARFDAWLRSLGTTPVLRELRQHFERLRLDELARHRGRFPSDQQEHIEHLTKALVNKLLHLPTTRLKEFDPTSETGLGRLDTVRELFDLAVIEDEADEDEE